MADAVGFDGMHSVMGYTCDYCGKSCDPEAQELNALDCTFANCPSSAAVYHQDCLERYLKSVRLEKSRKTGFKCPRGSGKGTSFPDCCPGKINKSHPIHIRNDDAKKRRKAQPVPPMERPAPVKEKAKKREEGAKPMPDEDAPMKPAKKSSLSAAKATTGAAEEARATASRSVSSASSATATDRSAAVSSSHAAASKKEQLVAAAAAAKRELGLTCAPPEKAPSKATPAVASTHTLEEYESNKAARQKLWSGSAISQPRNGLLSSMLTPRSTSMSVHNRQRHSKTASAPIAVPSRSGYSKQRMEHEPATQEEAPSPSPSAESWSAMLQGISTTPSAHSRKESSELGSEGLGHHPASTRAPELSARRLGPDRSQPSIRQAAKQQVQRSRGPVPQHRASDHAAGLQGKQGSSRDVLVGGDYCEDDKLLTGEGADAKALKAHRKNQRRAEKKARRGAPMMNGLTARDSFASSEILSEVTSDGLGELSSITHEESCMTQLEDDILEEPLEESELQEEMEADLLVEDTMHDDAPAVGVGEWVLTGSEDALADHGMSSSLLSRCMQAMRKHRMLQEAARMAALGFEAWQSLAALTCSHGDLREAIECLLRGQLDTPEQARAMLCHLDDDGESTSGDEAHMDQLQQAQTVWGVAEDTLHQMVVDHEGDVAAVLASLCDSQSHAMSSASTHNTTTAGSSSKGLSSPQEGPLTRSPSAASSFDPLLHQSFHAWASSNPHDAVGTPHKFLPQSPATHQIQLTSDRSLDHTHMLKGVLDDWPEAKPEQGLHEVSAEEWDARLRHSPPQQQMHQRVHPESLWSTSQPSEGHQAVWACMAADQAGSLRGSRLAKYTQQHESPHSHPSPQHHSPQRSGWEVQSSPSHAGHSVPYHSLQPQDRQLYDYKPDSSVGTDGSFPGTSFFSAWSSMGHMAGSLPRLACGSKEGLYGHIGSPQVQGHAHNPHGFVAALGPQEFMAASPFLTYKNSDPHAISNGSPGIRTGSPYASHHPMTSDLGYYEDAQASALLHKASSCLPKDNHQSQHEFAGALLGAQVIMQSGCGSASHHLST